MWISGIIPQIMYNTHISKWQNFWVIAHQSPTHFANLDPLGWKIKVSVMQVHEKQGKDEKDGEKPIRRNIIKHALEDRL